MGKEIERRIQMIFRSILTKPTGRIFLHIHVKLGLTKGKEERSMNEKRAREIAASPVMANVTYDGKNIYIENVNRQSANIHLLQDPTQRQIVAVNDLVEHPGTGGTHKTSTIKYGQPPY